MPAIRRPALLDGSSHDYLLRDRARLEAWVAAVREVVREGDVVADVGAGSGVLSWAAAEAGARSVYAVESYDESHRALLRNLERNGVAGRVRPVLADGTRWAPPEPVDVLVCELMETGLLHEPIAATMRNMHGWANRPRAVVPCGAQLLVEGVEMAETFGGYVVSYPGFRWEGSGDPVTDAATYAEYAFRDAPPPEGVDAAFALAATRTGTVDALRLRTVTRLTPTQTFEASPAYCTPLVLPLEEPVPVHGGETLQGRLRYEFDYTPRPIEFELKPA